MPSWSIGSQQDRRHWTGRQLIGVDNETDDESDVDVPVPSGQQHFRLQDTRRAAKKRILIAGDISSDEAEADGLGPGGGDESECSPYTLLGCSFGSQRQSPSYQDRRMKRVLLTAEELNDSGDDFQEQEEGPSKDSRPSKQSSALQRLVVMTASKTDPEEGENGDGIGVLSKGEDATHLQDVNVGMHSAQSSREISDLIERQRARSPMSLVVIDGGRAQEPQGGEARPPSDRMDALRRRKKAIKYLEKICLDILQQLSDCISLEVKSSRKDLTLSESEDEGNFAVDKDHDEDAPTTEITIPLLNRASGELKYLKYPRKPAQSESSTSLPIARLLRVCALLHEALVENVIVTKRDLYYKDVNLFGKQSVVDGLVDDIVASVDLKRADFNVVASPKGLMAASGLGLHVNDMREVIGPVPTLIPSEKQIDHLDHSRPPNWVLVIEKEASFATLCASGILADSELGDGVLITGKGYPDFATLHFLRLLADEFLECSIAVLVDADPYGLDILSVYQFGSKGMRFTAEANGLPLRERATWIGVKATEWTSLNIVVDKLIPITEKDERFAQSMLQEEDLPLEWKRQLAHMLHSRRKAEIQNLSNVNAEPFEINDRAEPPQACSALSNAQKNPVWDPTFNAPVFPPTQKAYGRPGCISETLSAEISLLPENSGVSAHRSGLYGYVKPRILQLLSSSKR